MTRPCCGNPPKDCYCEAMQEKGRKVEKVKGNEPTDADRERVWDLLDRFGLKPRAPVISSYANEALHEAIVELIAAVRAEYAPAVDLLREARKQIREWEIGHRAQQLMAQDYRAQLEYLCSSLNEIGEANLPPVVLERKSQSEVLICENEEKWYERSRREPRGYGPLAVLPRIDAFLAAHGKGGEHGK